MPCVGRDRRVGRRRAHGVIQARRGILEVGRQPRSRDPEDVVRIEIRRALGLSRALCDERDQRGNAATTRARAHAATGPVEPSLDRECRRAQLGRSRGRAHRHVVVHPVELQRGVVGGVAGVARAAVTVVALVVRRAGSAIRDRRARARARNRGERTVRGPSRPVRGGPSVTERSVLGDGNVRGIGGRRTRVLVEPPTTEVVPFPT